MSTEVAHRLGVALCLVAGMWSLVWALGAARRERRVRRRLGAVLVVAPMPTGRRFDVRTPMRKWLPVAGAVSACWVFVGGVPGIVVGLVAGFGVRRWQRRPTPAEESGSGLAERQLPLAADLLAACIAAGASPVAAAQAVGEALEGPVGERLARGAAEVRLGGEPAEAWRGLAALSGARALARLLERAGESGVPAASPVGRLAAEARAEWGRTATTRARRAAVMVTAPVGLCFLPAFIAIGVLPVVIGLAGGVLGGGG
ncbi:type II secretion system F family protein [Streptomyces flaveus]|uniref:Membrane protein n=1 Tax=Streptomyces flaveus TaxID=66370 RepID=A0A917VKP8_9ACTN|nr:type II secretion system F family protein [Streptomyces flaveus]GGK90472.1 membrane protein [Streptomyces flaveus]